MVFCFIVSLTNKLDIVGWRTSSIRRNNELPKVYLLQIFICSLYFGLLVEIYIAFLVYQWEDTVNEKYPHIVYEERCKAYDAEESNLTSTGDSSLDKLEGIYQSAF